MSSKAGLAEVAALDALDAALDAAAFDADLEAQLNAAGVAAIRRMMAYCSDPSSRWHAEAVAYVTPRKHALAATLAKHGTSSFDPTPSPPATGGRSMAG
jgi:hypothetical protein